VTVAVLSSTVDPGNAAVPCKGPKCGKLVDESFELLQMKANVVNPKDDEGELGAKEDIETEADEEEEDNMEGIDEIRLAGKENEDPEEEPAAHDGQGEESDSVPELDEEEEPEHLEETKDKDASKWGFLEAVQPTRRRRQPKFPGFRQYGKSWGKAVIGAMCGKTPQGIKNLGWHVPLWKCKKACQEMATCHYINHASHTNKACILYPYCSKLVFTGNIKWWWTYKAPPKGSPSPPPPPAQTTTTTTTTTTPKACCRAYNARCLACAAKTTVAKYCAAHNSFQGIPGCPVQYPKPDWKTGPKWGLARWYDRMPGTPLYGKPHTIVMFIRYFGFSWGESQFLFNMGGFRGGSATWIWRGADKVQCGAWSQRVCWGRKGWNGGQSFQRLRGFSSGRVLIAVWTGTYYQFYIDGVYIGARRARFNIRSGFVSAGRGGGAGDDFSGAVAGIWVYRRALSRAQVKTFWGWNPTQLVLYYPAPWFISQRAGRAHWYQMIKGKAIQNSAHTLVFGVYGWGNYAGNGGWGSKTRRPQWLFRLGSGKGAHYATWHGTYIRFGMVGGRTLVTGYGVGHASAFVMVFDGTHYSVYIDGRFVGRI